MMTTFDLRVLPPAKPVLSIVGSAVESPRAISGITSAINFASGGFWRMEMQRIQVYGPVAHKLWNKYAATLPGGTNTIIVPFKTEILMPIPYQGGAFVTEKVLHSDNSTFSDGAGHSCSNALAKVTTAADVGAGIVRIKMLAGGALTGGEIFSVRHKKAGWRAYRIGEVISGSLAAGYAVAITPPLRDAIDAEKIADFYQPRCLMRLEAGATLDWAPSGYWELTPDIKLVEAMGKGE